MRNTYLDVSFDPADDLRLSEQAMKLMRDYYMLPSEEYAQQAFIRAAVAYSDDLAMAERIYSYAKNQYMMFSSPVLSNAPLPGKKPKALPISCFLTYVPDSLDGLIDHTTELRWLSVKGGGVGGHWSDIRAVSQIAPGPIPFLKTVDADMTAYRQGTTRKGSYAAYLDIDHPDIVEFMNMRLPTGGDPNRKCLNLHNAINVTDKFMEAVKTGAAWNLIDPNDGSVRDTVNARELWTRILETRFRTGEPYINFIDAANRHMNSRQMEKGLKIRGSNLCNEIHLPTGPGRTAVCCLSSLNIEYYSDWVTTPIVEDMIRFLDNVLQAFIDNAPPELRNAVASAKAERALGLGAMGFHAMLQRMGIPWESPMAKGLNMRVFKTIKERAVQQSRALAAERGEPEDIVGTGMRNAYLLAIAPNANSSILCDTSPSIEPWKSNAFTHRTRAGSYLVKNRYLEDVLTEHGKNTDEVWQSIILNDGSVQQLDFLTDAQRECFKTSFEIDQNWIIEHASDRQMSICQGQSVNLFFPAGAEKSYVNAVHLRAHAQGLKGLYYLRTSSTKAAEKVSERVERVALKNYDECLACQG